MSSVRRPEKNSCWLIWELSDTCAYIRVVTSTEELADLYLRSLNESEKMFLTRKRFYKEKSQLNHLFGVSAIQKDKYMKGA